MGGVTWAWWKALRLGYIDTSGYRLCLRYFFIQSTLLDPTSSEFLFPVPDGVGAPKPRKNCTLSRGNRLRARCLQSTFGADLPILTSRQAKACGKEQFRRINRPISTRIFLHSPLELLRTELLECTLVAHHLMKQHRVRNVMRAESMPFDLCRNMSDVGILRRKVAVGGGKIAAMP